MQFVVERNMVGKENFKRTKLHVSVKFAFGSENELDKLEVKPQAGNTKRASSWRLKKIKKNLFNFLPVQGVRILAATSTILEAANTKLLIHQHKIVQLSV